MLTIFGIPVLLCEAKVNDVDVVLTAPESHQKIVWFDIPMEIEPAVNVLDPLNHLIGQHQHRF